jgi:hypothetical protein
MAELYSVCEGPKCQCCQVFSTSPDNKIDLSKSGGPRSFAANRFFDILIYAGTAFWPAFLGVETGIALRFLVWIEY